MTDYSVLETEDFGFVCAVVQSGDVAGREIEIDYLVEDSSMCIVVVFVCVCEFGRVICIFSLSADAQTQNGTLLFTDDATIQCVAVSVSSVTAGSTDESCLSLTLSAATTVTGLTLSPSLANICVIPVEGWFQF